MPRLWSDGTHYYTAAETAGLVRTALRRAFPGVRFGVTTLTYAGGATVRVVIPHSGPPRSDVQLIAENYAGGDFDGSIDMGWTRVTYLDPDGVVRGFEDPGSADFGGMVPGRHDPQPPGTVRAHLGATFVRVETEY